MRTAAAGDLGDEVHVTVDVRENFASGDRAHVRRNERGLALKRHAWDC